MSSIIVVFGLLGVAYTVAAIIMRIATAPTRETIQCPVHKEEYDVELGRKLTAPWKDSPAVDVRSCSHFDNPSCVSCDMQCLDSAHSAS